MKLIWVPQALVDLRRIQLYIAQHSADAAERWVERLLQRTGQLTELPLSGRQVPELGRPDVREVRVKTYRIVYRVDEDAIRVLTVFEGHRRLPGAAIEEDED